MNKVVLEKASCIAYGVVITGASLYGCKQFVDKEWKFQKQFYNSEIHEMKTDYISRIGNEKGFRNPKFIPDYGALTCNGVVGGFIGLSCGLFAPVALPFAVPAIIYASAKTLFVDDKE